MPDLNSLPSSPHSEHTGSLNWSVVFQKPTWRISDTCVSIRKEDSESPRGWLWERVSKKDLPQTSGEPDISNDGVWRSEEYDDHIRQYKIE